MGFKKRLKMYIKDDRPLKLKSFLSSHDMSAKKINLGHGRSLLHYCGEFGSPEMVRCLLNLGCEAGFQDNAGRLPLHCAIYRALSEDLRKARDTYIEIILPLLDAYPIGKDVEDMDMKTGQDLLASLKKKLKSGTVSDSEKKRQKNEEDERYEREWKQKMAQEFEFEMEEQQSRYDLSEDISDEDTHETFSAWTSRMHREHIDKQRQKDSAVPPSDPRKRRRRSYDSYGASSSKSQKNNRPQMTEEEKLNNARVEMKKRYKPPPNESIVSQGLLSRKKIYESKYSRFALHIPHRVTFGSVPWPCTQIDELVDILFSDLKNKESSEYKKYLRVQKVRWHPDKFSQKFQTHLHPDHANKIMTRVNAISQTLNALGS